jgi:hypothetical protein
VFPTVKLAGGPPFESPIQLGAPFFRAFCERVGSKNLNLPIFGSLTYESEVPTLAKGFQQYRDVHFLTFRCVEQRPFVPALREGLAFQESPARCAMVSGCKQP